jgi:hypothetical protein
LLLERSSKLQSDRQQGGDATTSGGVLYIKCTGTCCAGRPLELHSAGGCIYSGNAFEAHAGACALCSCLTAAAKNALLCVTVTAIPYPALAVVLTLHASKGKTRCHAFRHRR